MKKIIAICLALVMLLAFAACKGAENKEPETPATVAQALLAEFKKVAAEENSTEAIATKLTENTEIFSDIALATMPVEEGLMNGFNAEIKGFKSATLFAPMIGSMPFVGYIFETEDADALKEALKGAADLRWNICTQADEMVCESEGNFVFFVMAPNSFDLENDAEPELPEIPEGLAPVDDGQQPVADDDIVIE